MVGVMIRIVIATAFAALCLAAPATIAAEPPTARSFKVVKPPAPGARKRITITVTGAPVARAASRDGGAVGADRKSVV